MNLFNKCERCVTDKSKCVNCPDNPEYKHIERYSLFQAYIPVCPRGYTDCVCDPAYIKFHHPKWYKELYGNTTPEEAIKTEGGCLDRVAEDPNEEFFCYDDEDK